MDDLDPLLVVNKDANKYLVIEYRWILKHLSKNDIIEKRRCSR